MEIEVSNFNLRDTILSGSCFRVIENEDGSFTNILKDRVIRVKQEGHKLIVNSSNMNNIREVIIEYFDLNRNYKKIHEFLSENDDVMNSIISKCEGYKILNQEPFEMGISYIISQSNNVKRISKIINDLCTKYGEEVIFEGKKYHLFPTYEKLKELSINDFTSLKVGFRDKYIYDYIQNYEKLQNIDNLNTEDATKELMNIKGIGLKVASCILLFGYKRLNTFPIDTWVKKSISKYYNIKNDMSTIKNFTMEKFGKYSGLAIQYLFHNQRNIINKEKGNI